jgi:uncharacterized protein YjbJ (UPF0337 family)
MAMDQNRISGTARQMGGRVEEQFGRATGDVETQAEGLVQQAQGMAEDIYGQARDVASDAAQVVRTGAFSFEETLRTTIETRPYTCLLVAFGIGWLLGRTGQPY